MRLASSRRQPTTLKQLYEDLPLPTQDSIRLVKFVGIEDGLVNLSLYVVRLDEQPHFCALSYAWRSASGYGQSALHQPPERGETVHVKCNGIRMSILANLGAALLSLANTTLARNWFWIDYLCIDQQGLANAKEKNHQVSIMARIYSRAYQVIAWLDQNNHEVARALIKVIAQASQEDRQYLLPSLISAPEAMDILTKSLDGYRPWRLLAHFFSLGWFRRAWVIQEVINAQRLVLLVGANDISWDEVALTSHFLSQSPWSQLFRSDGFTENQKLIPNQNGPAKLQAIRGEEKRAQGPSLLRRLIRARSYDCWDGRDKVYSILGSAHPDLAVSPRLKVSYQTTTRQVYVDTAAYILETTHDLLLLGHCEGEDYRSLNLPSWVPDWSVTDIIGLGVTGYKRFNASGQHSRHLACKPQEPMPRLEVNGLYVDRITAVGGNKNEIGCPESLDLVQSLDDIYPTGEKRFDVWWRTLITDTGTSENGPIHPAPVDMGDAFKHWMIRSGVTPNGLESEHRSSDPTSLSLALDESLADKYLTALKHSECLRIFRTQRGYLGVGSTSLKVEDSIWIVSGSRIPLIFRSARPTPVEASVVHDVQLVGGAYVHGIMQGEPLSDAPAWVKVIIV